MSGGSRGIGLAIAKRCARDGANIAIAAKTAEPHPKLEGTIYTAAKEIEAAGGQALPVVCDIRDERLWIKLWMLVWISLAALISVSIMPVQFRQPQRYLHP